MGSNPVVSAPHATHIEERLGALDLLVVCDFFLSETARLADVVLPSAQWAEEDGTMTNLEGRVIRRRRVLAPPGGVRTDLQILNVLAAALGRPKGFPASARAALNELRKATAGAPADYSGITTGRIDREQGVFWPCPTPESPGTPRLFADRFYTPTGRARFHACSRTGPAERPDAGIPVLPDDRTHPAALPVGHADAPHRTAAQGGARSGRRDAPARCAANPGSSTAAR